MKKIAIILSVIAIILSFSGCKNKKDVDTQTTSIETTEDTTQEATQEQTTQETTVVETTTGEQTTKELNTTTKKAPPKNNPNNTKPKPERKPEPKPEPEPKPVIPNEPEKKPIDTSKDPFIDTSNGVVSQEFVNETINLFLNKVNNERASVGVSKLSKYPHLTYGARLRSKEISKSFSHTRPNGQDFTTILDTTNKYPYSTLGENIGQMAITGTDPYTQEEIANGLFNAFKESPAHYKNMINSNFKDTGIGIYFVKSGDTTTIYISQIFGAMQG